MPAIPRTTSASEKLLPRGGNGNGVSGAIAGIVVGCVFGLLLVATFIWICWLGKALVNAKWVSRKVEKVQDHAGEIYTTWLDLQHRPTKIHEDAEYEEL